MDELRSLIVNVGVKDFLAIIGSESVRKLCRHFSVNEAEGLKDAILSCDNNNEEIELYRRVDLNTLSKGERQIFILALILGNYSDFGKAYSVHHRYTLCSYRC